MKIVGCDLHARQQSIAMVDTETGELTEKRLRHEGNAVRDFYASLEGPVVVGIEATGAMQWFLELLEELGIECRVGHPAKIRAAETRKQKHDRRDAEVILDLLVMKDRFPDIWMPSTEQRDLRTLLRDRHQWVKMRTRLQHTLQAIALNHALREGRALWTAAGRQALQGLALPPYTHQRRDELVGLYTQLDKRIQQLDKQVEREARQRPRARRLLTHPGVGPVTALLRYLWIEATLHAVVKDAELKRFYRRKLVQKGMGKAMLRDEIDYEEFCRRGKSRQKGGSPCGDAWLQHDPQPNAQLARRRNPIIVCRTRQYEFAPLQETPVKGAGI